MAGSYPEQGGGNLISAVKGRPNKVHIDFTFKLSFHKMFLAECVAYRSEDGELEINSIANSRFLKSSVLQACYESQENEYNKLSLMAILRLRKSTDICGQTSRLDTTLENNSII